MKSSPIKIYTLDMAGHIVRIPRKALEDCLDAKRMVGILRVQWKEMVKEECKEPILTQKLLNWEVLGRRRITYK